MTTRLIILFLTCWSSVSCAQTVDSYFHEIALPLSGKKEYFEWKDLTFRSNPKPLQDDFIKKLIPGIQIEYDDSVFHMETGKFFKHTKTQGQVSWVL